MHLFREELDGSVNPSISCKVVLSEKPNKEAEAIVSALIKCSTHHFDGNEFSSADEKNGCCSIQFMSDCKLRDVLSIYANGDFCFLIWCLNQHRLFMNFLIR